ncbi:MAG: hypothetical protein KDA55_04385 [Planctomycetales bacterium]|nr:hypothetical protein [Planctomycetales bacterium]
MSDVRFNNAMRTNVVYWVVAIALPIAMRAVPTSTGEPPRIFDLLIPIFQIVLAFGAAHNFSAALRNASIPDKSNDM